MQRAAHGAAPTIQGRRVCPYKSGQESWSVRFRSGVSVRTNQVGSQSVRFRLAGETEAFDDLNRGDLLQIGGIDEQFGRAVATTKHNAFVLQNS